MKKGKLSVIITILIFVILIAVLLLYMITTNFKVNQTTVNEETITNINKTYGELKEKFGGVNKTNYKSTTGGKQVIFNNGYIAYFNSNTVEYESIKDNEKVTVIEVKFKDLFLNYNNDMLNMDNLQKIFTEGIEETPNSPQNMIPGRYMEMIYKGYIIGVTPDQVDENGNDKGYSGNSVCRISPLT